ncbi:MAG TPA: thiamine pyrophosphate-dependent dehydrogenase E1 component subunit alpha [Candidatus Binatia bacterium]|jgi:pyruvate dehydrogenase E1 component alpha subunit|nr:thiamine pyrophosphate-dependent dehydrogenase E1 component subunit alpha [Candidatus Binatia bacterium]
MAKKILPDILPLFRRMWLIRAFEEKASLLYAERQIAGLLHLSIGQEAVAVGACSLLRKDDYVFGGHRSHGHAIATGADINKLMAELAGRATGYCGGKGGSMHIVSKETGFITATGVVGGTIPLALGAAFAGKQRKKGQLAVVFFGDGAGQAGAFHESLNIASLWQLPVIFVCENNGYAEFTPLSAHTKIDRLAQHAKTYAIAASTVDGNDLFAVRKAMARAIKKCRNDKGPAFVECLTHRMRGHYEGDPAKYRELSQLAEWKKQDPIARVARALRSKKMITTKQTEAIEAEARAMAEKAAEFALSSPWPAAEEVDSTVYAEAR